MDLQEFQKRGREVIEFIIQYHETIQAYRIKPNRKDNFLQELLPQSAPVKPESWDKILEDVKNFILPNIVHWRHPHYFAFFPNGTSYSSILADMLISAINCAGLSWAGGPACSELENLTLNWLAQMIGLPDVFINLPNSKGGGVFQVNATDATLVTMIAARYKKVEEEIRGHPSLERRIHLHVFTAYCSPFSYLAIKKLAEVAMVHVRLIKVDDKRQLRGETLAKVLSEDRDRGLIPFYVFASLGSSTCCACDVLEEIGPVCEQFGVWLHVDSAYAGSALICPEFRFLLKGVQYAMSFTMDPSFWMLVNFDCCALWVQDRFILTEALIFDPTYLEHSSSGETIDYRHWSIPLSWRFRSLKLWIVLRNYGVDGLQKYIRNHVRLAKVFEKFIREDDRFIVEHEIRFGLVCFRLKGSNAHNVKLLSRVNASGKIFLVGSVLDGKYVIRFCICSGNTTEEDVILAWKVIREATDKLLPRDGELLTDSESDSDDSVYSLSSHLLKLMSETL